MSTENSTNGTNGTETQVEATKKAKGRPVYPTLAEAQANKPTGDGTARLKVFEVTGKDGLVGFTYADTHNVALAHAARSLGMTASIAGDEVKPEKVAALLDGLTDEQRAEILKNFTKAGKKKEAPAAA